MVEFKVGDFVRCWSAIRSMNGWGYVMKVLPQRTSGHSSHNYSVKVTYDDGLPRPDTATYFPWELRIGTELERLIYG